MAFPLLSLFDFGSKILDKVITSPSEKAAAQLELLKLQQSGELDLYKVQLSAIIAEAQSPDKWTSRARPSFMYVMYILLLWSIPMGFLYAFKPLFAGNVINGFKLTLESIPDQLYYLFGAGYLGYAATRSVDKWRKNGA